VYRMVLTWIRAGERPVLWRRQPAHGESVENYLRDGLRAMLGELAAHDPTQACSTWHPHQRHYGFWRRRMAHETTVHRVDVQVAAGKAIDVIEADIALDGIDEVLTLWFIHRLSVLGVSGTRRGTVAIRSGGRVWLVTVGETGTAAVSATEAELGRASAVLTAEPMAMYLWLWGRGPFFTNDIHRDGDEDLSAQVWALLRLATR
ncbi:MAG: maleylpyruvate isomerase N-terminal domain-containing protein, partial [Actinomycetota bacterium]|nr:maleylpyruvate isomerase N-terminal domain-containing protein [Actinomycetota bacterium]